MYCHKNYKFQSKISLVVTYRRSWIVGVQARHGKAYDGHTLSDSINHSVSLTNMEPKHIMVDKGCRGHRFQGLGHVHISGRIPKLATRSFRKMLKRRSAIELTIGHLKSDHRLERYFLKGKNGDRINGLISAIGYNFFKLLRALACLVFFIVRWFHHILKDHFFRI
jgi:IS5 family transposase